MAADCPAILGNLWDVTSDDIDKYTKELIETWIGPGEYRDENESEETKYLSRCISKARKACRLRYIVGADPVLYGIPLTRLYPSGRSRKKSHLDEREDEDDAVIIL